MIIPKIDIPDFEKLSKSSTWSPQLYQPMVYNPDIIHKSERLSPGSLEYDDFWDEMDYYCLNGFKPKGMPRITGRHFYYLNFTKIELLPKGAKKKVLKNPFYRDLDHMMFLEIEAAYEHGYSIIVAKPRRIGLSEIGALNCNYELTFFFKNKVGIAAGKDDKAQEFYEKLKSSLQNTHWAYKHGEIINNDKKLELGYKDNVNKQTVRKGIQSIARIKTMFADTGAFEGGSYSLVIFEEIGLFENLELSYKATQPCFMEGAIQFGVAMLYGTGGEIDRGAKGFTDMWENALEFRLKKIFIPAYYYYPSPDESEKTKGKKEVNFFNYEKGVTDRKAAREYIMRERELVKNSRDSFVKHCQSYPLVEQDVFFKTEGGILNLARLSAQLRDIELGQLNNNTNPVIRGRLEWVDTETTKATLMRAKNRMEKTKIRIANNSTVRFVIDEENGYMWKDSDPINHHSGHLDYKPDIGGCDSYDDEIDEYKKKADDDKISSGAIVAYRCFAGGSRSFDKPVGFIVQRGSGVWNDDEFYENAVKFAIYWDIEVLIEYTKKHIINFFEMVGAQKYLRERPENIDGIDTKSHGNRYGLKMPDNVKTVIIKLLKMEVNDNIHKYYFKEIIKDLMKFGDGNSDISMALGLCLAFKLDIFPDMTDGIEDSIYQVDPNDYGVSYYVDSDGVLKTQLSTFSNSFKHGETYVQNFIPERDLDPNQYDKYVESLNKQESIAKKKIDEFEDMSKKLGIDRNLLKLVHDEKDFLMNFVDNNN